MIKRRNGVTQPRRRVSIPTIISLNSSDVWLGLVEASREASAGRPTRPRDAMRRNHTPALLAKPLDLRVVAVQVDGELELRCWKAARLCRERVYVSHVYDRASS